MAAHSKRVYGIRYERGQLDEKDRADRNNCIEGIAKQYVAQVCAFQDVLTKKGYEPVSEVLKDDDTGIAALSSNGRLMIFGKIGSLGRPYTGKGLHTPKVNFENCLVDVKADLKLGESPMFDIYSTRGRLRKLVQKDFQSSCLRGLATNPNVSSELALECAVGRTIMRAVDETYRSLLDSQVEDLRKSYQVLIIKL